jgi:hypothetical protein
MYREIFEHPDAVPPSVKRHVDLTAGKDRGRIYRIAADGFRWRSPTHLSELSSADLVRLLAHENIWHRTTASRLLFERQDRHAVDLLAELAQTSASPLARMHVLYVLAGMRALDAEHVLPRLADPHPRVREHAVRLAEEVHWDAPAVRAALVRMVDDSDLRVRYQLAFTLGAVPGSQATRALAAIARHNIHDHWIRVALLSSCAGRAGELIPLLAYDASWRGKTEACRFLEQGATLVVH